MHPDVNVPEMYEKALKLEQKLKQDLEKAQDQLRTVDKQLTELQKTQQMLFRQRVALEALVNYLATNLD